MNSRAVVGLAAAAALVSQLVGCAQGGRIRQPQPSERRAAAPQTKDTGWPTFGHDYFNTRHVSLARINSRTVRSLHVAWKFQSGRYGSFESTPVVAGRTMFLTLPPDDTVVALDATNGKVKWRYVPTLEPVKLCCGSVNRGVAIGDRTVYVATLDDRLVALDAQTGALRWQERIADPTQGYSETMAPLVWNGMVFVGISGADIGIRGSLTAYSAASGRLLWRWWSVSPGWEGRFAPPAHRNIAQEKASARRFRDAWRRGGGSIWMTPALDPARSTIYAATGNPFPVVDGSRRPGDNLYTDSVVALDVKTGRMRWYFQEVAHDLWDYDAASPPVLFDTHDAAGRRIAAVGEAGKTGWFYILNRANGALIRRSQPFVPQWHMFAVPGAQGAYAEPGGGGGAVAPVAFDASSDQVFVAAVDQHHFARPADPYWFTTSPTRYGITAVNVSTGRRAWQHWFPSTGEIKMTNNGTAGACSVDDVVFVGEESTGKFDALDARSGSLLWQFQTSAGAPGTGAGTRSISQLLHDWLAPAKRALLHEPQLKPASHIHASPVAYSVNGVEYVAIGGDAFYRTGDSRGDTLYAFSLPR